MGKQSITKNEKVYIGFDVSQKKIAVYAICGPARTSHVATIGNCREEIVNLLNMFEDHSRLQVVMETGTHCIWMSNFIKDLGVEVVVANARSLRLIFGSVKKNDELDAKRLAELASIDCQLLHPVVAIDPERQRDLLSIKARDLLVGQRTETINSIRGHLRALGYSDAGFTADNMKSQAVTLPEEIKDGLGPLFEQLQYYELGIKQYDRQITRLCKKYPETKILRQIPGVGEITSLTFVLLVGDPRRFLTAERLSAYFGLVPRQDQSGDVDKQLGITKSGNSLMRKLLVQAANYILGNFGKDCDLKRFGQRIAARGGKIAKRKAKTAVARKLVTVLFALWTNPEVEYDPNFKANSKNKKKSA